MATVDVLNWKKEKIGKVDLSPDVFEKEYNANLIHTVVKWQLSCRRQGTHATKTKGLVSGSGKKPFKQKGTGQARQGSHRSPLMPGGGITFGPLPRDYSYNLPKKVRQGSLKVALSFLLREGRLFVVEDMKSEGKTNELNKRLNKFGLTKAVLVDNEESLNFKRAAKNLPTFRYYSSAGLNVYDLLKYDAVVITKSSVDSIMKRCGLEK